MTEQVELIGGPWDGIQLIVVEAGECIRLASVIPLLADWQQQNENDLATPNVRYIHYHRDVISDETHCWRYRIKEIV